MIYSTEEMFEILKDNNVNISKRTIQYYINNGIVQRPKRIGKFNFYSREIIDEIYAAYKMLNSKDYKINRTTLKKTIELSNLIINPEYKNMNDTDILIWLSIEYLKLKNIIFGKYDNFKEIYDTLIYCRLMN